MRLSRIRPRELADQAGSSETLFDQFHEALDVEPRPGAHERMRYAFTSHRDVSKRRPVLQTRWSKMGLRVAAVLAALVIAVALGAAILASRHGPVGSAPAGPDPSVKAYQEMIKTDYDSLAATSSLSCSTVNDTGCEASVSTTVPLLAKWAGDLKSFQTPARFAALDAMLQRHLTDAIEYQNAILAAHKSGNVQDFIFAGEGAFYENEWLDPTVGAIAGSYPKVAGSYHEALALARQHIDACVRQAPGPADLGCEHLYHPNVCANVGVQACASDAHSSAAQIQSFLISLLQNPAPNALAAKDRQIQSDLAQMDADIVAVTDGLLSGDSAKTTSAETLFVADLTHADNDIGVVGSA
jgi:hypothetical protein